MWKSDLNSCLTARAITYNVHLIQTNGILPSLRPQDSDSQEASFVPPGAQLTGAQEQWAALCAIGVWSGCIALHTGWGSGPSMINVHLSIPQQGDYQISTEFPGVSVLPAP